MQKLKGKKVDLGNDYDLQRYKEKLQETADTAKETKKITHFILHYPLYLTKSFSLLSGLL